MNPVCCGKESKLVQPSRNLEYYYCEVCKKEVLPSKEELLELPTGFGLDSYGHITGVSLTEEEIQKLMDDILKKSSTNLKMKLHDQIIVSLATDLYEKVKQKSS